MKTKSMTVQHLCMITAFVICSIANAKSQSIHKTIVHQVIKNHQQALLNTSVRNLFETCLLWENWQIDGKKPNSSEQNLFELQHYLNTFTNKKTLFHQINPNYFLLEIPCNEGAYNQSSIFFGLSQATKPIEIKPIEFPQATGNSKVEIFARKVFVKQGTIIEYRKMRGLGDAGFYARYQIDAGTSKIRLIEAIEKTETDGHDIFQWQGSLKHKPTGKTWQKVFPK